MAVAEYRAVSDRLKGADWGVRKQNGPAAGRRRGGATSGEAAGPGSEFDDREQETCQVTQNPYEQPGQTPVRRCDGWGPSPAQPAAVSALSSCPPPGLVHLPARMAGLLDQPEAEASEAGQRGFRRWTGERSFRPVVPGASGAPRPPPKEPGPLEASETFQNHTSTHREGAGREASWPPMDAKAQRTADGCLRLLIIVIAVAVFIILIFVIIGTTSGQCQPHWRDSISVPEMYVCSSVHQHPGGTGVDIREASAEGGWDFGHARRMKKASDRYATQTAQILGLTFLGLPARRCSWRRGAEGARGSIRCTAYPEGGRATR